MSNSADITMSVKMQSKCFADIEKLYNAQMADENQILALVDFINCRYDCADFRMVCILRSLYDFAHLISHDTVAAMKQCVLNFKYWMDEPGQDSMCYWSENHQLLFAVCEYLAGQKYPDEAFSNNGMSGKQHMEKAKIKIDRWLLRRFEHGFIEWHSNTYYEEDIAPLSLFIDLCQDKTLAARGAMLMDMLLLDLALHSFNGAFCATSGRCYEEQKKHPASQDVLDIIKKAFGTRRVKSYDFTRLSADFIINRNYAVPQVIRLIANAKHPQETLTSMGLDLSQVKHLFGKNSDIEDYGCFMWAMEAFTNVESVQATIQMYNKYKLQTNIFLEDLQMINIPILHKLRLLPLLVKLLNPVTQGVAIQRANTYTFKTADWMLSTAQQYHPQEFGDQQHIWQATLPKDITVFTTHPGAAVFDDNARNFSPSNWVGNGINPHSAQIGSVSLSLYNLKARKGFLEKQRAKFTHAYVPFDLFDKVVFTNKSKAFYGQSGECYIAILSTGALEIKDKDELVQQGEVTGWACVLGSRTDYGSFEEFQQLVSQYSLQSNGNSLTLHIANAKGCQCISNDTLLQIRFKEGFYINGLKQNVDYPRLSAFCGKAERYKHNFNINYENHSLRLDYDKAVREAD